MQHEDPAVNTAKQLWNRQRPKDAMLVLVRRIEELNTAPVDKPQPSRFWPGFLVGAMVALIGAGLVFGLMPDREYVVRIATPVPSITLIPSQTPDQRATTEALSTSIAGTNVARETMYSKTLAALDEIKYQTQTAVSAIDMTMTSARQNNGP